MLEVSVAMRRHLNFDWKQGKDYENPDDNAPMSYNRRAANQCNNGEYQVFFRVRRVEV